MRITLLLLLCLFIKAETVSAQKDSLMQEKETMVEISTDLGNIRLKLFNETPLHRDNFIKLVKEGFYDSLLFHRVINGFMIQGGDPDSKNAPSGKMLGSGDVGYKIPAEIRDTLYHRKGALAAARDGNPQKASSGCQFYIVHGRKFQDAELNSFEQRSGKKLSETQKELYKNTGGSPWLDGDYTVFGEVVSGMDVVDQIAATPVGQADRPVKDIRFSIKLVE